MNSPDQPQKFLALDGGKYARFADGTLTELVLGSCGRGKRGNAQFGVLGENTLTLLADKIREVCGLGTDPFLYQERDALVTSHLFVRFTPGTDRNGDALDIIAGVPGRRDRSFSIIGRDRIERLLQFIADNLKSIAA